MNKDIVYIVCGLPRSGTSLMMKMLEAGGLEPLIDNVRTPDEDNPKGYYEFERVKKLPDDTGWLPEAQGKVVKVLAELVKHLPDGYDYKVVFMLRDLNEIIHSQKKMMRRRGEDPEPMSDVDIYKMLDDYRATLRRFLRKKENMDVLYISYNELLADPEESLYHICEFFDNELNEEQMRMAIDEKLYRNRA